MTRRNLVKKKMFKNRIEAGEKLAEKNAHKPANFIPEAKSLLQITVPLGAERFFLYGAGRRFDAQPDYYRVFPRDSFTSAFLMRDSRFLKQMLSFCVKTQGKRRDPFTGEEPGKVPHEIPGVIIRGKSTMFNAADTTALFLIGFSKYWQGEKDLSFVQKHARSIQKAFLYLNRHIKDNIFWDSPAFCGAKSFALWSSYNGGFSERKGREVAYPVAYTITQAYTARALRGLADLLEAGLRMKKGFPTPLVLREKADKIARKIFEEFWVGESGLPSPIIDKKGKIKSRYLDGVYSLAYLNKEDVPEEKLKKIKRSLEKFRTPYGFLSEGTIWPWKQAYLYIAAKKFDLDILEEGIWGILKGFGASKLWPFPEYFAWEGKRLTPGGCNVQLWTIAYFDFLTSLDKWRISDFKYF